MVGFRDNYQELSQLWIEICTTGVNRSRKEEEELAIIICLAEMIKDHTGILPSKKKCNRIVIATDRKLLKTWIKEMKGETGMPEKI